MTEKIQELEREYKQYIDNHRNNVQKVWAIMKSNLYCIDLISKRLFTTTEAAISLIDSLIDAHDLSKYDEKEFHQYRKNFYPVDEEEKEANKDDFDVAWKHHYTNNLHHWNWWYESGNIDDMKMAYVVEMICDWEAMGYQFGNTSKHWYEQNKHNIHLGEKQKLFAEELMNIINK